MKLFQSAHDVLVITVKEKCRPTQKRRPMQCENKAGLKLYGYNVDTQIVISKKTTALKIIQKIKVICCKKDQVNKGEMKDVTDRRT